MRNTYAKNRYGSGCAVRSSKASRQVRIDSREYHLTMQRLARQLLQASWQVVRGGCERSARQAYGSAGTKSTLKRVGMWQHHCCPNVPPSKGTTNLHTRSHQATNLGHCLLTACAMIYHQGTQSVTTLKVIADNILLLIHASQPVSLSSSIAQRLGTHQGSNLTYSPRPGSLSSR